MPSKATPTAARKYDRLSAHFVRDVTKPGRYADGGNLFLQVTDAGAKSWVFRYKVGGRERMLGIGPVLRVGLREAREEARRLWAELQSGVDPLAARDALRREAARRDDAKAVTFEQVARDHIANKAAGWKSPKHRQQWENTLETYAYPVIGKKHPADVTTADVLKILQPIWTTKTETATRLRERIFGVLDRAESLGHRRAAVEAANPARWKNHLENLLADPGKVAKVKHQPALPFARVPAFVAALREEPGLAPFALAFAILTAARSGEVRTMRWRDVDTAAKLWRVPAEAMKAGTVHEVPLSPQALRILESIPNGRPGDYVFPGQKRGTCFSDMALSAVVRRMNDKAAPGQRWQDVEGRDIVPHGFRTSFVQWAKDAGYAPELFEEALAHSTKSAVARAYDREPNLKARGPMMAGWGAFCFATVREARKLRAVK